MEDTALETSFTALSLAQGELKCPLTQITAMVSTAAGIITGQANGAAHRWRPGAPPELLWRHGSPVVCVACDPNDPRRIVTADADGSIRPDGITFIGVEHLAVQGCWLVAAGRDELRDWRDRNAQRRIRGAPILQLFHAQKRAVMVTADKVLHHMAHAEAPAYVYGVRAAWPLRGAEMDCAILTEDGRVSIWSLQAREMYVSISIANPAGQLPISLALEAIRQRCPGVADLACLHGIAAQGRSWVAELDTHRRTIVAVHTENKTVEMAPERECAAIDSFEESLLLLSMDGTLSARHIHGGELRDRDGAISRPRDEWVGAAEDELQ
jgi:hypothetical protein